MIRSLSLALVAGVACSASAQIFANVDQAAKPSVGVDMQIISDNEIYIDGVLYESWQEVGLSGALHTAAARCGLEAMRPAINVAVDDIVGLADVNPSDCTFSRTRIMPDYDPSVERYRIPVVVHVIQRTNGTGFLSNAQVESQIDILNEDFQALPGSLGAPGTDMNIEFYLATEDPQGNPTDGILNHTNNTWFNDGGSYWNSVAWDTNRYVNIYTNSASGNLGYVPNLPQGGIAGSNSDRVVVLYSSFGRNAPLADFDLGRTGTHEMGHYFGLEHTFSGGCGSSSSCYTTGDLICDTNPESSPFFGCSSGRSTCGSPDPIDNYMDYSDDICMNKFTPEQVNRMRCSLLNYRPNLYEVVSTDTPCAIGDIAVPFGVLDLGDVDAFIAAFVAGDSAADVAFPFGLIDLTDIDGFIASFTAGCP
ncbi:MAG: zinc metalloprotease [Planctomycetota bacterium]